MCNPGGTDVCTWNGVADRWDCDVSAIGETGQTTSWLIYGERTDLADDCGNICDGKLYCAFGVQNGVKFYCDLPQTVGQDLQEARLLGTEYQDILSLQYHESTTQCRMKNHGLNSISLVVAKAIGNDAADEIHGSWETNATYQDDLQGSGDDDEIYGHEGADLISGGGGWDQIHAGDGADEVYGDDGADYISGGFGDDELYGGNTSDFICGDDGDDTLHGGAAYDYMWGGDDADVLDGAATEAACYDDGVDTLTNCDIWADPPEVCPVDVAAPGA